MNNNGKETHGGRLFLATWGNRYPLVFVLALGRFLLYVCKLQWTEACLSTASSFYSACGYAVRMMKSTKRMRFVASFALFGPESDKVSKQRLAIPFPKHNEIKYAPLLFVGAIGSLIFALLAVWGKFFYKLFSQKDVWSYFSPTQLDVLGSIFTQLHFYAFAHQCFWSIRDRKSSWVTDATIALTCKWYAKNPYIRQEDVNNLKKKVVCLINAHPEWDETILARLWDFIGEEKKAIEARRSIARKVAEGTL